MDARRSYHEAAARGASPVRLVILLYEQAIADLGKAVAAHRRGDIEGRTREINHAILVLGQLQMSLDRDQGGQVAQNLERFYRQVRSGLVDAQLKQSPEALEQQISHLMLVHEAWREVERTTTAASHLEPTLPATSDDVRSTTEWKA